MASILSNQNYLNRYLLGENIQKFQKQIFEGLNEGKNEWVNIQSILREVIGCFLQIFQNQAEILKGLDNNLEDKLTKQQFQKTLEKYSEVDEIKNLVQHLEQKIAEKITFDDVKQDIELKISQKTYYQEQNKFQEQIENQLKSFIKEEEIQNYKQRLQDLEQKFLNQNKIIEQKASQQDIQKIQQSIKLYNEQKDNSINSLEQIVLNNTEEIRKKIDEKEFLKLKDSKLDKQKLIQIQNQLENFINKKQFEQEKNSLEEKLISSQTFNTIIKKINSKLNNFENLNLPKDINTLQEQIKSQNISIIKNQENFEKKFQFQTEINEQLENEIQKKLDFSKFNKSNESNQLLFNNLQEQQLKIQQNQHSHKEDINLRFQNYQKDSLNLYEKDYENLKISLQNLQQNYSLNQQQISKNLENFQSETKIQFENFEQNFSQEKNVNKEFDKINKQINSLKKNISTLSSNYISQTSFEIFNKKIQKKLQQKCDLKEAQNAIKECNQNYSEILNELRSTFEESILEIETNFKNKYKLLVQKKDFLKVYEDFEMKQKIQEQNELVYLTLKEHEKRIDIMELKGNSLEVKISQKENNQEIKEQFKKFQKILNNKINTEDFESFQNQQVERKEINQLLQKLQNKIKSKVNKKEVDKLMEEQSHFNKFFCTEFIVARYKWKSGILLDNQIVPFNMEIINTLKQNFLWSKNSGLIGIINGGLYEIQMGFFGQKIPQIKLYLNDKIVYQSSNKNSNIKHIQTFNNIGQCKILFLMIQDNSQIKIQCLGEMLHEGFINIRRLQQIIKTI